MVIDEIDGAGGGEAVSDQAASHVELTLQGFVKSLLKLIQDVPASKKRELRWHWKT